MFARERVGGEERESKKRKLKHSKRQIGILQSAKVLLT